MRPRRLPRMHSVALAQQVLANPISPDNLLSGSWALLVLAAILFAECGLLVGFFLPGDTLLFAAGIYLAIGDKARITQPLAAFLVVAPLAAIAGNIVGYWIGRKAGPRVFTRPESAYLDPQHIARTEHFLQRWGAPSVILGRFVPVVRTFITVMAGVGKMPFAKFATFSVIGGILWADGVLLLGYALGHITWVQEHKGWVDVAVIAVVVIVLIPSAWHVLRARRAARTSKV